MTLKHQCTSDVEERCGVLVSRLRLIYQAVFAGRMDGNGLGILRHETARYDTTRISGEEISDERWRGRRREMGQGVLGKITRGRVMEVVLRGTLQPSHVVVFVLFCLGILWGLHMQSS